MVPHALPLPAATQCMVGIESKKILEAQGRPQTSTEHIYLGLPGSKRFSLHITAYRRQKQMAQEPSILGWGTKQASGAATLEDHTGGLCSPSQLRGI